MTAEISREQMIEWLDEVIATYQDGGDGTDHAPVARVIRAELSGMGWQDISTAPKDGTPIATTRTVRYLPYKPDGQRQMRKPGRWQEWNGYGWENCQDDPSVWYAITPPVPGSVKTNGGER